MEYVVSYLHAMYIFHSYNVAFLMILEALKSIQYSILYDTMQYCKDGRMNCIPL
ncbi:hypothetical protein P389DRAFT_169005 [Cystobasidium minutum MCA 4210]|uniref:uncharacterized protein n=1 Tax=Cystobasidium minutum MCA 4210 TaxID=1397322 RepID=UPI0034CFDE7F|eukprot:jgi/Rhomi1/169005/fgenesh1_kg.3_\